VWGRSLSHQERGCLHFFRNSFHSPLSQTRDDINIRCLVVSSAFRASGVIRLHVSGMQTAGLAWGAGCRVSPLCSALSKTHLGSGLFCPPGIPTGWRNLSRVPALAPGGWLPAWEHPNAFPTARLASPGSDCSLETRQLSTALSCVRWWSLPSPPLQLCGEGAGTLAIVATSERQDLSEPVAPWKNIPDLIWIRGKPGWVSQPYGCRS